MQLRHPLVRSHPGREALDLRCYRVFTPDAGVGGRNAWTRLRKPARPKRNFLASHGTPHPPPQGPSGHAKRTAAPERSNLIRIPRKELMEFLDRTYLNNPVLLWSLALVIVVLTLITLRIARVTAVRRLKVFREGYPNRTRRSRCRPPRAYQGLLPILPVTLRGFPRPPAT